MREKLFEVKAAYERVEMLTDLLMAVIERTGQFTEGYYSLKLLSEHSKTLNKGTFMDDSFSPEEALDRLVLQLSNIAATVQTQIDRLEAS